LVTTLLPSARRPDWQAALLVMASQCWVPGRTTDAVRYCDDAGNATLIPVSLAILAVLFERLGRYEPAATVAGIALSPMAASTVPQLSTAITHLRDVLGDQTYESLARKGETMTTAEMVSYAYDQIDQARAELNAVSERRHMRVSKLRLSRLTVGMAICRTSLTSDDTILTWIPMGMVALD
jgi:hypothetical protein